MSARQNVTDLLAFLAVAKEGSFTRAGAKLGVSQSALSHTIRGLEERLGLRLLPRTTRRVAPTEVGARLLGTVGPRFEPDSTRPHRRAAAGRCREAGGPATASHPDTARAMDAFIAQNASVWSRASSGGGAVTVGRVQGRPR